MPKTLDEIKAISARLQDQWSRNCVAVPFTVDGLESAIATLANGDPIDIPTALLNDIAAAIAPVVIVEPTPETNLSGLVSEFTTPGMNTLYASIAGKIAIANQFAITDHWQNLKLLLDKRDPEHQANIALGINYLAFLLDRVGQSFSQSDRESWNTLCDKYHLDASCRIADAEQLNAQFVQSEEMW